MCIIAMSVLLMLVAGISYASKSGVVYDYLFGTGSSSTLIESSKSTITLFSETVFGNSVLNKILFFVFWMVVGLVVYTVLNGLSSGANEAGDAAEELHFVHAKKSDIQRTLKTKIILRLIALGLLVFYTIFLIKIFIPFGVLSARIVAGSISELMSWLYGLLGLLVLCGSFYLGLILIRFLLLRPRIFGGQADLLADELEHGNHQL